MADKILTGPLTSIPVRKEREAQESTISPVVKQIVANAAHCLNSWATRNGVTEANPSFSRLKNAVDDLKKVVNIEEE